MTSKATKYRNEHPEYRQKEFEKSRQIMNEKYKNNPEYKEELNKKNLENYYKNQEERKKKALEYYYRKKQMKENMSASLVV
jgi:hypothetical protein